MCLATDASTNNGTNIFLFRLHFLIDLQNTATVADDDDDDNHASDREKSNGTVISCSFRIIH